MVVVEDRSWPPSVGCTLYISRHSEYIYISKRQAESVRVRFSRLDNEVLYGIPSELSYEMTKLLG
jgi:hypothetical protein